MRLLDFTVDVTPAPQTLPVLYKAVKYDGFGISDEGQLVSGLTLVIVSEDYEWFDALEEDIAGRREEASIIFPEEGLKEGAIYSVNTKVTSTDWDTGYADDWVVELVKEMD